MASHNDAIAEAADREAAHHGYCCKCCSLRAEIWACFAIDITSIIGLLVETPSWYPAPANLHVVDEFRGYLIFSVFSACLVVWAMFAGKEAAWPRRVLVRFMSLKLPFFLVFCMAYFTLSPWAAPLAQWVCENDFEQMRTLTGGGNYDKCVRLFPWLTTANNAIYIPAYAYSFKASYDWFRCHPDNDNEGIWCPQRAAPPARFVDYTEIA